MVLFLDEQVRYGKDNSTRGLQALINSVSKIGESIYNEECGLNGFDNKTRVYTCWKCMQV